MEISVKGLVSLMPTFNNSNIVSRPDLLREYFRTCKEECWKAFCLRWQFCLIHNSSFPSYHYDIHTSINITHCCRCCCQCYFLLSLFCHHYYDFFPIMNVITMFVILLLPISLNYHHRDIDHYRYPLFVSSALLA